MRCFTSLPQSFSMMLNKGVSFAFSLFYLANFELLIITVSSQATVVPEFHENAKITAPALSSFETLSVLNCIHRCQLHNQCNLANVKQANSKFQCVFSRVECFEKLEDLIFESHGWYLYKLPEKYCKAPQVSNCMARQSGT